MDGQTLAKLNLLGIEKPHISREGAMWKVRDGGMYATRRHIYQAWEVVRTLSSGRWYNGRPPVPPCSPSCRHL